MAKEPQRPENRVKLFPKGENQTAYWAAIDSSTITIASGVAGTGKTYLAAGFGVQMLKSNRIKQIIITRPVVEAGESLGYLPGEIGDKVGPYNRPITDALKEFLREEERTAIAHANGIDPIELCPLAYMRGRTFKNSLMILDEAQNTTVAQMLMFLTRIGQGSRIIITGDLSQSDLTMRELGPCRMNGLEFAIKALDGEDQYTKIIHLEPKDIQRHDAIGVITERFADLRTKLLKNNEPHDSN